MRSKDYLKFIASKHCMLCGGKAEPHHVRKGIPQSMKGGSGLKSSDFCSLPLCRRCHTKAHAANIKLEDHIDTNHEIIKNLVEYIKMLTAEDDYVSENYN